MQGWFPWFASRKDKAEAARLKKALRSRQAITRELQQEQQLAEREANKELGIFSDYGISVAKSSFWCVAHPASLPNHEFSLLVHCAHM